MRVVLLVACMLSAGCVASSDDSSSRREPVSYAKPPGNGWACFRDRMSDALSLCTRPGDCDGARAGFAKELDRRGVSYDLTTCATRAGVACMTFRSTTAADVRWICMEFMSECESVVAFYREHPTDYRDVSDCGAW